MNDSTVGITFRETMRGGFALGETDPAAGEKRGKEEGTVLTMHASIEIPDVRAFIADASHGGRISGEIAFPPLGKNIAAKSGVFQLFSPTENPGMKLMVYELLFETGGTRYYLAGRKEVRNDPGLDVWTDTTTLFTRLHKGADKTAPVAGAGILTLGLDDLARLVSTMRSTGAGSIEEQAKAVLDFGRFFLGELWDSYGKGKA